MKLRSIQAVGLGLKSYAPSLRLVAQLVQKFPYLNFNDAVSPSDVLTRVVTFARNLAIEIAIVDDGNLQFSAAKVIADAVNEFEETVLVDSTKACADLSTVLENLSFAISPKLDDTQYLYDALTFANEKAFADISIAGDADYVSIYPEKVALDEVNEFYETLSTSTQKSCEDLFSAFDAAVGAVNKAINDEQVAVEGLTVATEKLFGDYLATSDITDSLTFAPEKALFDAVETTDYLTKVSTLGVLLLDGGSFVDADYADYAYFDYAPAASDSLALKPGKTLPDSFSADDVLACVATQYRTFTDIANYNEQLAFDNRKVFGESNTVSESLGKGIRLYLLEGGLYADPTYFVSSDYVSGGLVASESLTHSP